MVVYVLWLTVVVYECGCSSSGVEVVVVCVYVIRVVIVVGWLDGDAGCVVGVVVVREWW